MRFRLQAFGLHLAGSACALTLILGGLYLGWYRWPGWYLTGVLHVLVILGIVDLGLGPTLTLIVANRTKPGRVLARDIAVIASVQLLALLYGAATLWQGRPLYYTFSTDRLEMVQASDLEASEIALARQRNPGLAPHWYSTPRWVWAPLPDDPEEASRIVNAVVLGQGQDIIDMPRYFRSWEQALPKLREHLHTAADLRLSKKEQQALSARLSALGVAPGERNAMVLWGDVPRVVVIFDPATLRIRAILKPA
jgi:hypothetical protein